EARLKQADSQLIASQAQLVASQDAYKTAVGHPPGNLEGAPSLPPLPRSAEDAQTEAIRNNPSLLAAHETEKASNAAVKVAVGALLPSVSLVGQYNHSEGQKTSFGPGATFGILSNQNSLTGQVTIPIYQAGSEYASIRQAKHTASQNRLLSDQALRDTEESVAKAWENLRAPGAAIASNKEQVNANQIAYEGVVQEAQVGSRTTLDVLNAEQELLNSQVTLVQSQRDQYVAAYTLLSSMGALTAQKLVCRFKFTILGQTHAVCCGSSSGREQARVRTRSLRLARELLQLCPEVKASSNFRFARTMAFLRCFT